MPGHTIGRYQVRRVLGTGGFATVYLAHDDGLDADVAVKVLAENWSHDPEVVRRFVQEARLLRRLDDDRVVRVYTIEELADRRPFFVMSYADRGTLADRMGGAPLAVAAALEWSAELAACLEVVHHAGVVHRDLKPSNVLFTSGRDRTGERMVLGDFGLARELPVATGHTVSGGTALYAAPEQVDPASAAMVDARADVYAAAVILREMLTGDAAAIDVAAARPDVPAALVAAIATATAADPAARYPGARDWADVLRRAAEPRRRPAAAGRPLPVPPPGHEPPGAAPAAGAPGPTELWPAAPPAPATGVARVGPATVMVPAGPLGTSGASGPPSAPGPVGSATVMVPPGPLGTPGAASPPSVPPGPPGPPVRHRKRLWALVAGVLGAAAVVVAVVVLAGGAGRGHPTGAAPPPTTNAPVMPSTAPSASTTPTTSSPAASVPLSPTGPASWFRAASGPGCGPSSTAISGVVSAESCSGGTVTADFVQFASPAAADAYLGAIARRRRGGGIQPWSGKQAAAHGSVLRYSGTDGPAIAWTYDGEPYVGVAVGRTRVGVDGWWATTGRVID